MKLIYFASGSSGNCTYYSDGTTSILIDNGTALKYVTEKINGGILLTHEHYDHHSGVARYMRKYRGKSGISTIIDRSFYLDLDADYIRYEDFIGNNPFNISTIEVQPFGSWHDVPCFYFMLNKEYIHLTDTGTIPFTLNRLLEMHKIKVIYLESNYDEELIEKSDYDEFLKYRIKSKIGHLSNQKVTRYLKENSDYLKKVKYIVLGHLSENTNTEEKLDSLLKTELTDKLYKKIIIAKKGTSIEL